MTRISPDILSRAWLMLMVLSGGSAVVAALVGSGLDRRLAGTLIILLALFKARIILSRYLGLSQAPTWRRGFNLSLSLFCLMLLGLYLASGLTA